MSKLTIATGAEADAKAHLQELGIYGKSSSVVSNLFRISNIIRSRAETQLFNDFGLSFSGFTALWVLWVWGPMETNKLAQETAVAKSTLTGVLKTLERGGYTQRQPHPEDKRRVVASATPEGQALMQEIYPLFHQIEDDVVSELSDEDLDITKDMLRMILATVSKS